MCGIVGFTGADEGSRLQSMCRLLTHRGPDEEGYYRGSSVSLGMRRLAIIDLSSGQQPIFNEDETVCTVFNGEIYNYESLHSSLESKGHTFRTRSDTETIVHAYEEYGLDFVQHLRGMFGIAVWDKVRRRLVLARDRLGEKPLYYAEANGQLYFGSEIKSVLFALDSFTPDADAINQFLTYGFVPGDRTFYNEIKKLPPGHLLTLEDGNLDVRQYWDVTAIEAREISEPDAVAGLTNELCETVAGCLKSDVEVGAFLSGGLDSSLLTAIIKSRGVELKTFSVGYEGEATGFNELSYAKKVAEHVGTDHHELILKAQSSMELLPKLIGHYDEPHGEPTSALVYHLTEYTAGFVKVAIGGNGADELFLGYPRHKAPGYLSKYHMIPGFMRSGVLEPLIRSLPESTSGSRFAKRAKRFVNGLSGDRVAAVANWTRMFSEQEVANLLSGSDLTFESPLGNDDFYRSILSGDYDDEEFLRRLATLDMAGYLPEYQLGYMDRMSMANSLEVRAPYCDYKLVEYAHSLPASLRLKNGKSKYVLKEVARHWLPDSIIDRKKVGFDSPIGLWFKNELSDFLARFMSKENLQETGILNPDAVHDLIEQHMSGRRDLSLHLWSLVAVEMWYRMYFEHPVADIAGLTLQDVRGAA